MQLTQSVEVGIQVRITYKSPEDVRLGLVASAPYAEGTRSASVTHTVEDPAMLGEVVALCERLVAEHAPFVARQALRAATQAEAVAQTRGELS